MITTFAETEAEESRIPGVHFKDLKTFPDERGFFREVIRDNDPFFQPGFAQWSHSKMAQNTVKAWHFHHRQVDWWYLGIGVAKTVLIDNREESETFERMIEFKLGDPELDPEALAAVVRIPQGVLHACKVLTDEAHLFYITSRIYDPEDEGRLPFNQADIGYDWGEEEELIVSAKDRDVWIPPFPREELAGKL